MTDTAINTPERQGRIAADLGTPQAPEASSQVAAQVDADLAEEAEAQALRDEKSAAVAASFAAMLACPICGANSLGTGSGFVRRLRPGARHDPPRTGRCRAAQRLHPDASS